MKLNYEEIKKITFGSVGHEITPDGIRFLRCTKKQILAYTALEPVLGERAASCTGIRLDFHTDAEKIRFSFSGTGKIEVLLDGLLRRQFRLDELHAAGEAAELSLTDVLGEPQESTRVTVALSSHSDSGSLNFLELPGATYCRPHIHACRLLMLGDSITQGWDSHFDTLSYAHRITNFFDADSIIQGVGGAYFHESTLDRLDFDPDLITVAFGTNDFTHYRSLSELRAHAAAYLSGLSSLYPGKRVIVISPIYRGHREGRAIGSFADCCRAVREETERAGMIPVDGFTLFPPMDEFLSDGYLHPNDLGFGIYAENLAAVLRKYL